MSDYSQKTDEELVALTLEDKEVFLHIMKRYEKKLIAYIHRISSANRADAEDILQNAFIKAYENLQGFQLEKSFSSWIYRITHNETIDHFRKQKHRQTYPLKEKDLTLFAQEFELESKIKRTFDRQDIQDILDKMKPKYREVLILKYLEQKSYKEISTILKKPIGTIGTLINRAKKHYQKHYEKRHK